MIQDTIDIITKHSPNGSFNEVSFMTGVTGWTIRRKDADAAKYENEKTNLNPFPLPCKDSYRGTINSSVRAKIIELQESCFHDTGHTEGFFFFKSRHKIK